VQQRGAAHAKLAREQTRAQRGQAGMLGEVSGDEERTNRHLHSARVPETARAPAPLPAAT
jgi:hypothetical protein